MKQQPAAAAVTSGWSVGNVIPRCVIYNTSKPIVADYICKEFGLDSIVKCAVFQIEFCLKKLKIVKDAPKNACLK